MVLLGHRRSFLAPPSCKVIKTRYLVPDTCRLQRVVESRNTLLKWRNRRLSVSAHNGTTLIESDKWLRRRQLAAFSGMIRAIRDNQISHLCCLINGLHAVHVCCAQLTRPRSFERVVASVAARRTKTTSALCQM